MSKQRRGSRASLRRTKGIIKQWSNTEHTISIKKFHVMNESHFAMRIDVKSFVMSSCQLLHQSQIQKTWKFNVCECKVFRRLGTCSHLSRSPPTCWVIPNDCTKLLLLLFSIMNESFIALNNFPTSFSERWKGKRQKWRSRSRPENIRTLDDTPAIFNCPFCFQLTRLAREKLFKTFRTK